MADSLGVDTRYAADILFRIKWSLVQRALQNTSSDSSRWQQLPVDVQQLLEEAQAYTQQGDYELAIPYLDVVLDYLPELAAPQTEPKTTQIKSDFSWQLFCGSDLWQQKFSVAITDEDSTIYEDQNNAFIGIRTTVNIKQGPLKNSRMSVEAKVSGEYLYGYHDFIHRGQPRRRLSTSVENRLEGMHYNEEKELRYWHDRARALIGLLLSKRISFSLEDEVQVRRYARDSSLFSSFWQNQAALTVGCDLTVPGKTDLRYDLRWRRYFTLTAQNYQEHLVTWTVWPNYFKKNQLSSYSQFRIREYVQALVDSLLTNPFNEWYHETKFKHCIGHNLYLQLGATANWRHYRMYTAAMPHYRDLTGEAALEYQVSTFGSIKIGYRHRNKWHYFSQQTAPATAAIENFYADAPILEIDIFYQHFLFNLSNVYETRRYPASPAEALSLYADRDVYTLYLFLSWAFSRRWEINVMANIDNDWARNPSASDSRSNIINFELLFKF